MKKTVLSVLVLAVLVGCSSTPEKVDPNYAAMLNTQKEIATKEVKPILEIEGIDGKEITFSGVKAFRVYAGASTTAPVQQVQPYIKPKSDFAESVDALGNLAGKVLNSSAGNILAGGYTATELSKAVGSAANHGYQWVQAPAPNQTISGTGVIGSGSLTQNTLSGTGTLGGGSYSSEVLSGTGTLGSGSYSTDILSGTGTVGGGSYSVPTTTTTTTNNNQDYSSTTTN